jgi:hypothetical protein
MPDSSKDGSDETLTQEAADRMADALAQALQAIAQEDGDGRAAETAKMRHILDNPNSREADAR